MPVPKFGNENNLTKLRKISEALEKPSDQQDLDSIYKLGKEVAGDKYPGHIKKFDELYLKAKNELSKNEVKESFLDQLLKGKITESTYKQTSETIVSAQGHKKNRDTNLNQKMARPTAAPVLPPEDKNKVYVPDKPADKFVSNRKPARKMNINPTSVKDDRNNIDENAKQPLPVSGERKEEDFYVSDIERKTDVEGLSKNSLIYRHQKDLADRFSNSNRESKPQVSKPNKDVDDRKQKRDELNSYRKDLEGNISKMNETQRHAYFKEHRFEMSEKIRDAKKNNVYQRDIDKLSDVVQKFQKTDSELKEMLGKELRSLVQDIHHEEKTMFGDKNKFIDDNQTKIKSLIIECEARGIDLNTKFDIPGMNKIEKISLVDAMGNEKYNQLAPFNVDNFLKEMEKEAEKVSKAGKTEVAPKPQENKAENEKLARQKTSADFSKRVSPDKDKMPVVKPPQIQRPERTTKLPPINKNPRSTR